MRDRFLNFKTYNPPTKFVWQLCFWVLIGIAASGITKWAWGASFGEVPWLLGVVGGLRFAAVNLFWSTALLLFATRARGI